MISFLAQFEHVGWISSHYTGYHTQSVDCSVECCLMKLEPADERIDIGQPTFIRLDLHGLQPRWDLRWARRTLPVVSEHGGTALEPTGSWVEGREPLAGVIGAKMQNWDKCFGQAAVFRPTFTRKRRHCADRSPAYDNDDSGSAAQASRPWDMQSRFDLCPIKCFSVRGECTKP